MQKMPDIAVMLLATDGNMQIYDVNPEVCREFGYSPEELIGQYIGRYLTQESRQMIKQRIQFREMLGGIREMQVVDLKALLDSALKPLQARISEQQATIIVEGELPLVTIGSVQLGLVLHNLVDNALLYASPDRP
jgi:light-regulated signal transduction histidine kinase (bacteriophytochrome)